MTQPLDLLAVAGSIRPRAYSPRVAACLAGILAGAGHNVTRFDIRHLPVHGSVERSDYPPIVAEWQGLVRGSDGILWVVPTYHGNIPGVLKNALDLVSATELRGQVHAVAGVALGNGVAGAQGTATLLRLLGGRLPMYDLFLGSIDKVWGTGDEPATPEVLVALERFAGQFAEVVSLFRQPRGE